jgi:hypothetical protein
VKRRATPILVALASAAAPAAAQPAGAGHAMTAKGMAKEASPKGPAETDPQPNVQLGIEAPSTRGAWVMRVANDGDVPVRIVADARLLTLEVFPRGAREAVRCDLPPELKPEDDLERPLVLPPHRAYRETFEPRLYCMGGRRLDALAPGAIVVAHLGWTGHKSKLLEVSAIEGVEPRIAGRPSIDAPPVALPDEPTPRPVPVPDERAVLADVPRLSLQSAPSVDATSASAIEIPLTLRNDGARAVVLRFRPESLRFDLLNQERSERCTWPGQPGAPLRELFTTVPPKATSSLTVVLGTFCTTHAFDQAGLYVVTARLDTRGTSGASLGLHTFDGEVFATSSTVVRLRRGRAPKVPARPRLEPSLTGP